MASPWDIDSITAIFGGRQPDPIEGLWQFPADGAVLLIEKRSASTYDITILDSPSLDVRPGTVIGTAVTTPTAGVYDANFDPKPIKNKRLKKANAALKLSDGYLSFKPYTTGKRVALWRWIPYFFRITVFDDNSRPSGLDGARRIYPPDGAGSDIIL